MEDNRIKTIIGFSVINLTKYLMETYSVEHEEAYRRLVNTDFYEILNDPESGLYLETEDYLRKACLAELEQGKDAMYAFINRE